MSADLLLIYITWSRLPTRFAKGTDLEEKSFAHILRRDGECSNSFSWFRNLTMACRYHILHVSTGLQSIRSVAATDGPPVSFCS